MISQCEFNFNFLKFLFTSLAPSVLDYLTFLIFFPNVGFKKYFRCEFLQDICISIF